MLNVMFYTLHLSLFLSLSLSLSLSLKGIRRYRADAKFKGKSFDLDL